MRGCNAPRYSKHNHPPTHTMIAITCYAFYALLTTWLLAGVWAASAPHQEYVPLTRAELRQAAKLYTPTAKVGNRSNAVILSTLLDQGYV